MVDEVPQLPAKKKNPGGRPAGSANKLTRSLANELCRQGLDGLSLMVKNAVFWDGKANELAALIEEQLTRIKSIGDKPQELAEALVEFNKTHKIYIAVRERLQGCAVDMAPYTNPKLQSVTLKKSSVHTEIHMNLNQSSDDSERKYRDGGTVVSIVKQAG